MLDPKTLKKDFPIFGRKINGKPLIYLDNASTTQKPECVLAALERYYREMNANIHRGIHTLSEEATEAYEATRQKVADFIHAKECAEIIFTRNATEAINLVAYTWGEQNISSGDNIVVTALEHHSNLVPWQELCRRKNAELKIVSMHSDGTLDLNMLNTIIDQNTKLVAVTQMSNVLGTISPLEKIITQAHTNGNHGRGAKVLIDGAQGVAHMGINVQELDADFVAFSAHKMLGPTGVGVLYGKRQLLEAMPPFMFGGDMVLEVSQEKASWNQLPWKFEAGTPNIADVIAFKAALEYVEKIGFEEILEHDQKLLKYAREQLSTLPNIKLFGSEDPDLAGGVLSFSIPGIHPHDIGSILNEDGVAIRAGHHCAQPLMNHLGVNAAARMSFYIYNNESDIDAAVEALKKVYKIFKI